MATKTENDSQQVTQSGLSVTVGSASVEAAKNIRFIHWGSYPRGIEKVQAYAEIIEREFRQAVRAAAKELAERAWHDLQTENYTLTTDEIEQRIAARLFRPNNPVRQPGQPQPKSE